MKRKIAILLTVMAMLTACGSKTGTASPAGNTETTQAAVTQVTEAQTQATEAETQEVTLPSEPEYPGVYWRTWSEEIGGTVTDMNAYIVLNEDGTGYWIAQGIGMLNWDEGQLALTIGVSYEFALVQENGTVNLLVYEFQDENGEWKPTVYEKIDELPAELREMLDEI